MATNLTSGNIVITSSCTLSSPSRTEQSHGGAAALAPEGGHGRGLAGRARGAAPRSQRCRAGCLGPGWPAQRAEAAVACHGRAAPATPVRV
jgi:hypothetical protein